MTITNRKTLKNYFKRGNMPTEAHFESLIDSMFSKIDDGLDRNEKHGLILASLNDDKNLISFYQNSKDANPSWTLGLNEKKEEETNHTEGDEATEKNTTKGLRFESFGQDPTMFLSDDGNVGIGTQKPTQKLEVKGAISSIARMGIKGACPADGEWHVVVGRLSKASAFEVVARTGVKATGRHALIHATALSTYGGSRYKIKKTSASYQFWRRCGIKLRFVGGMFDYQLQIRSLRNEGKGVNIDYHVTSLWDDDLLVPDKF